MQSSQIMPKTLFTTLNRPRAIPALFTFTGDYCTIDFTLVFIYLLSYFTWAITWHTTQAKKKKVGKEKYLSLFFLQVCCLIQHTPHRGSCRGFFPSCWGLKLTAFCESAFYATRDTAQASPSSRKSLSNIIMKYHCYIYTPRLSKTATRTEQREESRANQTDRKGTCPPLAPRAPAKRRFPRRLPSPERTAGAPRGSAVPCGWGCVPGAARAPKRRGRAHGAPVLPDHLSSLLHHSFQQKEMLNKMKLIPVTTRSSRFRRNLNFVWNEK